MTSVAFHFNVPDQLNYSCRLVRKALRTGSRLVVTGPRDTLDQLDQALWVIFPTDFIAHAVEGTGQQTLQRSPVILTESVQSHHQGDVLINLGEHIADSFDRFDRVIEVVGLEDADKRSARVKWKAYTQAGFALLKHDLSQKVSS